ncbi:MAG: hypothetical protein ABIJ34_03235 [archaeon]
MNLVKLIKHAATRVKERILGSTLNRINNAYTSLAAKLGREETIVNIRDNGVIADIGQMNLGAIAIDLPEPSYKKVLKISHSVTISSDLENLVDAYSAAGDELKRQIDLQIQTIEDERASITGIVSKLQSSEDEKIFTENMTKLRDKGVEAHIKGTGYEPLTLRELGKLTFRLGEKWKGTKQIAQSYLLQAANSIGGVYSGIFPKKADSILYSIEKGKFTPSSVDETCARFNYTVALQKQVNSESMVDYVIREYVNNYDKTISDILSDARSIYKMQISKSTLYRILDKELGSLLGPDEIEGKPRRRDKNTLLYTYNRYMKRFDPSDVDAQGIILKDYLDSPKLSRFHSLGTSAETNAVGHPIAPVSAYAMLCLN